jgi:hypothetical protein
MDSGMDGGMDMGMPHWHGMLHGHEKVAFNGHAA